jgi:hypothetical protein
MKSDIILMAHGSGGLMSQRLIDEVFKRPGIIPIWIP